MELDTYFKENHSQALVPLRVYGVGPSNTYNYAELEAYAKDLKKELRSKPWGHLGPAGDGGSAGEAEQTTLSFRPPNHGPLEVPGFCGFWAIDDRVETGHRRRRARFRAEVSAGLFWRPNHRDTLAPRVTEVRNRINEEGR